MAAPAPGFVCPRRRFGRTGLHMSVISLGGMRYQQTWKWKPEEPQKVEERCQANVERILARAEELGINHVETARGYGSSEYQLSMAFKKLGNRKKFIVQSKCCPKPTEQEFRDLLDTTLAQLKIDCVDLLSVHGINRQDQLDWTRDHCIRVLREYREMGKIRFIGFSSHAPTDIIVNAIRLDVDGEQAFDYANMHYHFVGSHTSSGSHLRYGRHANRAALEAATERDLGIFIISPFDKGGRLYAPVSKAFESVLWRRRRVTTITGRLRHFVGASR